MSTVRATMLVMMAAAGCGGAPEGLEPVVVARVLDGDTIETEAGLRVRYLLVDTPEVAPSAAREPECFAEEARAANAMMVGGAEVGLEYDAERADAYGRALAYLWLDGRMVNEILLERGYARLLYIPPNARHLARLRAVAQAAGEAGAGLWGACP